MNGQEITKNSSSKRPLKNSLYIALLCAFIDNMGVGLVYPLFSAMLFDPDLPLVSSALTQEMRGFYLGLLIAIMPLTQFFTSPMWGALSDRKGRKRPLELSISMAFIGYLVALISVHLHHIGLLFLSRILVGCASGNISIVQASIADLSSAKEKAKNFGLFGMALGLGFTLGPFFGGTLSRWGYFVPFLFASFLTLLNVALSVFLFVETKKAKEGESISWKLGLKNISKAIGLRGVRPILLSSFLHNFGWSYFFEFVSVYLIIKFHFDVASLGLFYGLAGAFYALSTGVLIQPLVKRFKPITLFFLGNLFTSFFVLLIPTASSVSLVWPLLFLICFTTASVAPSSVTIVSNQSAPEVQGQSLGILGSVNALALACSPVLSGSIVGAYPQMPMFIGGGVLLLSALIIGIFGFDQLREKISHKEENSTLISQSSDD